ncbi:MAG: hydrogenase formation protein HypD [Ignavibacteria bacterium]
MKYIEEYRNPELVRKLKVALQNVKGQKWNVMEVCGGQTHTIMKYGIDDLLPANVTLLHGPGCPVCVTPVEYIDAAIEIALNKNVILASYGDMLRVPGSNLDLLSAKGSGADVRIVYSPLDAIRLAQKYSEKDIVFFAIGFETTAPANGQAVLLAQRLGLKNFFLLSSHVLVPPALRLLLNDSRTKINAVLAAGHVCSVMGYEEYIDIAEEFRIPIVVTGFEPTDILEGLLMAVKQLEKGIAKVENQYRRVVLREGNIEGKKIIKQLFNIVDRAWRGIGLIPHSGLELKEEYSNYDALRKFSFTFKENNDKKQMCIAGEVLRGIKKPFECLYFRNECSPEHPIGAPMVSSEGACAAYYRFYKK